MATWEVFRKHGNSWRYLGVWSGSGSLEALRAAHRSRGYRVLAARPEYSSAKLFVARFPATKRGA